jgi:hypothetical protein
MGQAVIVGHGPSMKGGKLGEAIDDCAFVVRLKNCSMLLAERRDYGRKTDVMCSSTEVLHHLYKVKAKEYWGYPKKGFYNENAVTWLARKVDYAPIHVPLDLCNFWNLFFQEMGARHPNVSTGTAALIIALDRLPVDTVYLAGFDNVLNPAIQGYKSTVPTAFNGGGNHDTGHDWATEHRLLPFLQAHFKKDIKNLARSYDISSRSWTDLRQNTDRGTIEVVSR